MPIEGIPLNGARVRAARHKKLWSQTQLAEAVGVTTRTISRWESREARVPTHTVRALNIAFGYVEDSRRLVTFDEWPPSSADKAHT